MDYLSGMTAFARPHVDQVVHLLTRDGPQRIIAVTGPRQTGKTTIVGQALRALERKGVPGGYIAVDDPSGDRADPRHPGRGAFADRGHLRDAVPIRQIRDTEWLVQVWERSRMEAARNPGFILALDEIQIVKGWSGVVKGLWDRDRASGCPLRVIVTGSAPWAMLTGLNESLAGRFLPVPVQHWSLAEMMAAFDFSLEEYLFFGGYPGAAEHLGRTYGTWREDEWREYVQGAIVGPAIKRDIVSLARVDKPALMRHLVDLVPHYSGQILSYNKMLGQLQDAGNTTTLARYLDLLSDAGLVAGLSKYSRKPHLRRRSSPKLNVLNTAVMTASSGYTFKEANADRSYWGRIVESTVGAHLYNTCPPGMSLHYWRDKGNEVDFVLSRGPHLLGIEVKSGKGRAPPGSAKGTEAFMRRFPGARSVFVVASGHSAEVDRPARVPLHKFLAEPAPYWLERRWESSYRER